MGRGLLIAATLVLFTAAPLPAAAQTAAEQRQFGWILERGRLLFGLDRAAWVATDDLLERVPDAETKGVRGYVVEQAPGGYAVTFYARGGQSWVAAYRARVGARGVEQPETFEGAARPQLTPTQLRLAAAAETAREKAGSMQRCANQPFNVAVVPPAAPDAPIDVYMMAPQTSAGFPLGGHYRITLDAAGKETSRRAFARSCLTMKKEPDASGAQPVGMVVSHLVDPIPTEIHVFTALAAEVSVYVAIARPRRLFEVTGRNIRLVSQPRR